MRSFTKKINSLYSYFFNNSNSIRLQLINVMFILLAIFAILATITTCLIDFEPMIVGVMSLAILCVLFSLWLANSKKKINTAGIMISVFLNIILQPMLFLTTGGRMCGMPIWSLCAILFNWLVVEGIACYVLTAAGILTCYLCCLVEEYNLIDIYTIPTSLGQINDLMISIISVTLIVGLIYKYQSYVYEKQRKEITEKDKAINATLAELERTNQELSDANEAKGQFLANMSHEIRTPINAILGMNELIQRENKDDAIGEYSDNIKSAGDILLSLVNDILDYSKIGSGKMNLVEDEYIVIEQINSILALIVLKAEAKGLNFNVNVDPNMPSKLYGDELRIKQITTNLLTNAVKYTKEGTVTLNIDVLEINNGRVKYKVSVIDTGIGIKEDELSKLFELFTRLDEEQNKNIEGTGLGIAISQSLLSLMDSKLNVESEYGKGSTFSFELEQRIVDPKPIGDIKNHIAEKKSDKIKNTFVATKATVLFVDDVELNLKVAKGIIRPLGMNLHTATSGKEAIELCKRTNYDIIFMDHMMPEMDGLVATGLIRKLNNYYKTAPIVALTANAVAGAREMFLEAGMNDFISKPIDLAQLYKCVERYLPQEKIEYIDGSDYEEDIEEVPEIDGINSEKSINILGSKKAFIKEVKKFYANIEPNIITLKECENSNDIENYEKNIHDIKVNARTIAADEIAYMAQYLEQCCKELNIFELKSKSYEFIENYKVLKENIKTAFGEIGEDNDIVSVTDRKFDAEDVKKNLQDLLDAMDAFDLDKADKIVEKLAYCNFGSYLAEYKHIELCISSVDFVEAKVAITQLLEKL